LQSISCRCEWNAVKRLHGENYAESFGIWEAEFGEKRVLQLFEIAPRARASRFYALTDLTHFCIFRVTFEPDFTHYLV